MAESGINIGWGANTPAALVAGTGARLQRVVARREIDLTSLLRAFSNNGIRTLMVYDRGSFQAFGSVDPEHLAATAATAFAEYARRYNGLVFIHQPANEPDGEGESSWSMSQADVVTLGRLARQVWPDALIATPGLVSGQPSWLDGVPLEWASMVCPHPYGKQASPGWPSSDWGTGPLAPLLDGYAAYGKPLLVSEIGLPVPQVDEAFQAEYCRRMMATLNARPDVLATCWFALTDDVPGFGLYRSDGSARPAVASFKASAATATARPWPVPGGKPPVDPPAPTDLRAYAKAAAVRAGVPPLHFERQIQQESGFDPKAYNAGSGASGIAQIIPKFHPTVDPWNPTAALDYAATYDRQMFEQFGSWRNAFAGYNWGPGNVSTWDGRPATLPAETRHYLDVILGPGWPEPSMPTGKVTYNKLEPAHAQEESFDCSQEALEWALWAYGRQTSDDWLESTMIAEGVMSKADGLLDATGAGLAAFINRQYGELGYSSNIENPVSFDFLAAEFGPGNPYPGLLGGRAWGPSGHWAGLRTYDPVRDLLLLANPSDGHGGVGQTMSRQQFAQRGPFSMVRVMHKDVLEPTGGEPEPKPPTITRADLDTEIAHLTALRDKLPA